MTFDEFCERIQLIVLEEMERMYEECKGREWTTIEEALRERLILTRGFRSGQHRYESYLKLLNENGKEVYERLRQIRKEEAARSGYPPYIVFSNRTLFEMCRYMPLTEEALCELYGAGDRSVKRYGQPFLEELRFQAENGNTRLCSDDFLTAGEQGYPLLFGRA